VTAEALDPMFSRGPLEGVTTAPDPPPRPSRTR
jgi:hypothetical protein